MYHNLFFNKKQFKTPCISTGRFKNKIIMRDLGLSSPWWRNQNARTCTSGLLPSPILRNVPLRWHLRIAPTAAIVPFCQLQFRTRKNENPGEFQQGVTLADRNRRTRTPATLDISQLLSPLSYVPKSTRSRTRSGGNSVF